MNRTEAIIYNKLDPWTQQKPHLSKDFLFQKIQLGIRNGSILTYTDSRNDVVYIAYYKTPFILDVHLFSDVKNPGSLIRLQKDFLDWVFQHTSVDKLETLTRYTGACILAERCGWNYEGTRKNSFVHPDGNTDDVHLYGISREEVIKS